MSGSVYGSNGHGSRNRRLAGTANDALPPSYIDLVPELSREGQGGELLRYWLNLYRNKGLVLGLTFGGALLGYLFSLPQPPIYQASTSLEVQEINQSFLNIRDLDPNARSYSPESQLQTEMKMLESKSLIRMVRDELGQSTEPLQMPEQDQMSSLLQRFGLPVLRDLPTRQTAIAMASGTVRLRNPTPTRIVEIVCDSTDPQVAASFVNALAETYIEQTVEGRLAAYQQVTAWLNRQVDEIRLRLQKSEDQMLAYSKEAGLLFTADAEERLRRLQGELFSAQTDLIDKKTDYRIATTQPPEVAPQIVNNGVLLSYQAELAAKRKDLTELGTILKPEHYKIRRLRDQVEEAEAKVRSEETNVISRIRGEFEAARLRSEILEEAHAEQAQFVSAQDEKLVYYNMLKREVETNRQLYDSMSQKVKESSIASAMRASNVRVVDRAEPPGAPYKPNTFHNVLLGGASSFVASIILVFAWRSSDRRFHVPGEAASYLQIPELGVIPSISEAEKSRGLRRFKKVTLRVDTSGRSSRLSIRASRPHRKRESLLPASSEQAESFRGILASVLALGDRNRVILVTSPSAGSGKTSVICNLGAALAEIDRRVLLIDADLRKPEIHKLFGLSNDWGLKSLVSDPASFDLPVESMVQPTSIYNLFVLPSGPGNVNIPKLLYSSQLKALLERLRSEFSMILIDTPPMLQFADARVLTRRADEAILVFRSGRTTREMGATALQQLMSDGASVLGVVLNDWNGRTGDARGSGYSYHRDQAVA